MICCDSLQTVSLPAEQMENSMGEMAKVSFDKDQISVVKRALVNNRPYADRMSLAFAVRLLCVKTDLREDPFVLDEVDYLEALCSRSRTKREEQFRHPPLHPFWHKHYSAPRHFWKNIGIRWNLSGGGNRDLQSMLNDVAERHGSDPDRWQRIAPHWLVVEGYKDRAERGLTGDWIIFAKHEGQNYYLDLATHEEGTDQRRLYEKLRQGSAAEFPFLFD